MRCGLSPRLFRRAVPAAAAPLTAAVPPNYSNIPYQKQRRDNSCDSKANIRKNNRGSVLCCGPATRLAMQLNTASSPLTLAAPCLPPPPPPPAPMRSSFIRPVSTVTRFNGNERFHSFRCTVRGTADVSLRPIFFLADLDGSTAAGTAPPCHLRYNHSNTPFSKKNRTNGDGVIAQQSRSTFGDRLRDTLSCRWAAKFYGQVTFGPRNYPYPSSRWLARRFKMKKHKIVKRFRFRRYKLAAVANLPFAKMIRVGMLPELKSSKTKKGDAVDAGLSAQLVSAAKSTSSTGKATGRRSRPKSKYQV